MNAEGESLGMLDVLLKVRKLSTHVGNLVPHPKGCLGLLDLAPQVASLSFELGMLGRLSLLIAIGMRLAKLGSRDGIVATLDTVLHGWFLLLV
jgi:hypothetical protein